MSSDAVETQEGSRVNAESVAVHLHVAPCQPSLVIAVDVGNSNTDINVVLWSPAPSPTHEVMPLMQILPKTGLDSSLGRGEGSPLDCCQRPRSKC
ncbi:Testis-Specific Protein 10-Interacting Protein [Manis pentadactyla]|nr:Testis-Specific Protein 10-Interacting Protein [Manis pentadactyla]